jgi:hypothetical protein
MKSDPKVSERIDTFQRLVAAEMKSTGADYQTAFDRVGRSAANAELTGSMQRAKGFSSAPTKAIPIVRPPGPESVASCANAQEEMDVCVFGNQRMLEADGWVQLAPYGDFANVDARGQKVIQRFGREDAERIVQDFKSRASEPGNLLGLPWYIGHPDHPRFRGKPGHTDSTAKGRIKALEARADGLYANVKFNGAGQKLLEDEAFHGHSVNWNAAPAGRDKGCQVYSPISLKSVGFTNMPQIPVIPAMLS